MRSVTNSCCAIASSTRVAHQGELPSLTVGQMLEPVVSAPALSAQRRGEALVCALTARADALGGVGRVDPAGPRRGFTCRVRLVGDREFTLKLMLRALGPDWATNAGVRTSTREREATPISSSAR